MPMDNSLNLSELLKRLGVVGDSKGSAALLDQLRLTVNIANLDDLVPPVGVPVAAALTFNTAGVGVNNGSTIQCLSAGGLIILGVVDNNSTTNQYFRWISAANPFAASAVVAHADFTFGQPTVSIHFVATPEASAAVVLPPPVDQIISRVATNPLDGEIWVGPGQFFNVMARQSNVFNSYCIYWKEITAGLNPI